MEDRLIDAFTEAAQKFDLSRLIHSGVVVVLTIALLIVLNVAFKKFKARSSVTDDVKKLHTFTTAHRIVKAFVVVSAILAVLQLNGVNVGSFVLLIGVLIAVAVFAVKDAFQDIFAGFIILLDRYYKVGDAVEFDGKDGVVIAFSVRTTKIEYLEDRSVISVANRNISKIRLLTHLVDIDLPLSYDEERERVFRVLEEICGEIRAQEGVEDCEFKGTQDFGESAIVYKIRFFCEPHDRPDIRRAVLKTVQDGLHRNGIRIPYTQIDVHEK